MSKFHLEILNYLLDKYERSVLSKNGSQKNIRIFVKIRKLFPKYDNSDYYSQRLLIDEACHDLAQLHILYLSINDDGIVDIQLNLLSIQKAYDMASRVDLANYRHLAISLLKNINVVSNWLDIFKKDMIDQIENFKNVSKYLDILNENEIIDIFKILNGLERQEQEISLRKFSLKILKDSKCLETMKSKIINIINDYYSLHFIDENELFSHFNVIKNPGFIYLYGHIIIELNQQVIDLGQLNSPFSLTSETIKQLNILDIQDHYILTIENLTSFYDTHIDDTLTVYLGGYHNSLRRELLLKIYHFNHQLHFYHFGDIDAGGFYIYLHLKEKTKIPFQTLAMNKKVLQLYSDYTKKLTQNDRIRLTKLKDSMNDDVIYYMLENNCKLEQEIVNLTSIDDNICF